jgi:predicted DNA-binding transcriptional regulator AlpA
MPPRAKYQPPPPNPDPLMTIEEVARALRSSKRSIQRWCRRGLFPQPIRFGTQKQFWLQSTVKQVLDERTRAAARGEAAEVAP